MRTIAARKTLVGPIDSQLARNFIQENHSSGATLESDKSISLGLSMDGELLAVIQFCSPRTSAMRRKYTVELLRLAFKSEVKVVGGASKLSVS